MTVHTCWLFSFFILCLQLSIVWISFASVYCCQESCTGLESTNLSGLAACCSLQALVIWLFADERYLNDVTIIIALASRLLDEYYDCRCTGWLSKRFQANSARHRQASQLGRESTLCASKLATGDDRKRFMLALKRVRVRDGLLNKFSGPLYILIVAISGCSEARAAEANSIIVFAAA